MNNERMLNELLLTIAFSLFGMLLIFGLGFVFPTINPYVVIKWIIIVCAVVFACVVINYIVWSFKNAREMLKTQKTALKKGGKK